MNDQAATGNCQRLCVHSLIAATADRDPDAPAVLAPGRSPLGYGRLLAHVGDVGKKLNEMGLGRNDRIAIVLPNGPKVATAFIAVAAGATGAPLNPNYRANEFDYYLSDLNARALIVQSGVDSPAKGAAHARGISVIELTPLPEAEAGIFSIACDTDSTTVENGANPFSLLTARAFNVR